jgi:hypothetical protein
MIATELITERAAMAIQEARDFLESNVSSVTITNEAEYTGAATLITQLKAKRKSLDETRAEEKEPHLTAGREVDASFKPVIDSFAEKIQIIEKAGRDYRAKQQEIAAAIQRKLIDEAEANRKKLESQAGTNAEKASALREKAMEYVRLASQATDPYEKTRLQSEASKCEVRACKYDDKREAKIEQAAVTVAPVVVAAVPQNVRGAFNTRTTYESNIVDLPKLLDFFKTSCPPTVLAEIKKFTDSMARASRGTASTIPGVTFFVR